MMRRSTDGYTYTPPQPPEPPEPPERTVSVKILQLDGTDRTSLYRDEIFDVEIKVTGEPAYTGTMRLKLIAEITEECLGDRGMVQMYDFANLTPNPLCDKKIKTSITSVTFAAGDKGIKRFKAVVNKEQTIQIKVIEIDENGVENEEMSAVTPATSIDYRLRQYTTKHTNGTVNDYDGKINEWRDYWDDWNIGAPPDPPEPAPENPEEPAPENPEEPAPENPEEQVEPYTFITGAKPDGELVKAVAYMESSLSTEKGAGQDLMQMTGTALNGLTTDHGDVERDPDASALPEGYDPDTYADDPENEPLDIDVVAPYMNYGTPTADTIDDSFKWGIRWLIAKRSVQLEAERVGYRITTISWWGSNGAIERYGDPKKPTYAADVQKLYEEGRNPHPGNPTYLWPIKADGCPRQTSTPKPPTEENPENPPEE